jgi:hypothetical protein
MLDKLSAALLIAAAPAAAQDGGPAPAETAVEAAAPVAYKTKKVCRSIDVVGSSIPRRSCTTKRIPIAPVEAEPEAESADSPQPEAFGGGR